MNKFTILVLMIVLLAFGVTPAFAAGNQAFRNVQVAEPNIQFTIQGEARVWGGMFFYELKADGEVIREGMQYATLGAPDWGTFKLILVLRKDQVQGKELQLEIYEKSMKDGSKINQLQIPLQDIENNTYQNQAFRNVTGLAKYIYEVQGEARVFEGTYHFEVSDGHHIIVKGFGTTTEGSPEWGTFHEKIEVPRQAVPVNGTLVLELYEPNMSDQGPPRLHRYFHTLDSFPW